MKTLLYTLITIWTVSLGIAQEKTDKNENETRISGLSSNDEQEPNYLCGSFKPIPGKKYVVSAWVKEIHDTPQKQYEHSHLRVAYTQGSTLNEVAFHPSGAIVEGWQRIIGQFTLPLNAINIQISFEKGVWGAVEDRGGIAYIDDIRFHPFNGNLKSFVYDKDTQRLMAELDENNYATYYKYDSEGGLVLVQKETERGVYTIQEGRSNTVKQENLSN